MFQIEKMPKTFRKGSGLFICCMLIVSVVWFVVFYLAVNINSILMAFKSVAGIDDLGRVEYVWGLENFRQIFREFAMEGSDMRIALRNTMKYFCLNFFLIVPLTYFTSYFLYKKILFHKFFRVLFYLPSIISGVTMVIIYKNIIGGYGPLYMLMRDVFGITIPAYLTNASTATNAILVYCVWTGFGVNIVLYQGAMGRVPEEILEAAKLDGVSWWRELFEIITPLVWGTVSMTLILAMTGIFTTSGPILLFGTDGSYETWTISYLIFSLVYSGGVFQYPAAIGVFFTICSIPIVFAFRYLMNKIDPKIEY